MNAQIELATQLVPAGLPAPARIMFANGGGTGEPWITYPGMSRAAAAAVLTAWEPFIAPKLYAVADGGCTYVKTAQRDRGTLKWELDYPAVMEFNTGDGFSSVKLYWHAVIDGRAVRCSVELQAGKYGHTPDWSHPCPYAHVEHDQWGNALLHEAVKKVYPNLAESRRIEWAGGSNTNVVATYYYARDNRDALLSMLLSD